MCGCVVIFRRTDEFGKTTAEINQGRAYNEAKTHCSEIVNVSAFPLTKCSLELRILKNRGRAVARPEDSSICIHIYIYVYIQQKCAQSRRCACPSVATGGFLKILKQQDPAWSWGMWMDGPVGGKADAHSRNRDNESLE